jgi:predicted nuclease of predicted toxin-antitoxin system
MRFLIDNNLSPVLADELKTAGHDAVHVRDDGLQAATGQVVLAQACGESRVLISADTDFGTPLAREGAGRPSIVLIRRLTGRRATEQAAIILANLDVVSEDLDSGAVVVLTDEWVRVRRLPIVS